MEFTATTVQAALFLVLLSQMCTFSAETMSEKALFAWALQVQPKKTATLLVLLHIASSVRKNAPQPVYQMSEGAKRQLCLPPHPKD